MHDATEVTKIWLKIFAVYTFLCVLRQMDTTTCLRIHSSNLLLLVIYYIKVSQQFIQRLVAFLLKYVIISYSARHS